MMDSFVLVAYASLGVSRTLLQRLLASLNFTLDSKNLLCWYNQKKWFLWTMAAAQVAETMENSEAWPDTYNEGYIHQFQPKPTRKVH